MGATIERLECPAPTIRARSIIGDQLQFCSRRPADEDVDTKSARPDTGEGWVHVAGYVLVRDVQVLQEESRPPNRFDLSVLAASSPKDYPMEVPYHASGASFRGQYALASVLNSSSNPDAEARTSIRSTLARLSSPHLTPSEVKECLLLLMQAEMALSLKTVSLEPAFTHAVKLAESGPTLATRTIAFGFLRQYMPVSHPMSLLLVNTIRKDIESKSEPRIILALHSLIHMPSEDVIPAVRARLAALLTHQSPSIQQLALSAIGRLAALDISICDDVKAGAFRLVEQGDPIVLSVMADVLLLMIEAAASQEILDVTELVQAIWSTTVVGEPGSVGRLACKLVGVTGALLVRADISDTDRGFLSDRLMRLLADETSRPSPLSKAVVLEICRWTSSYLPEAGQLLILKPIRAVLAEYSPAPNDMYWALASLEAIPIEFWSNALDESEVKLLVASLNADDESTRRAALRVFKKADRPTLKIHFEALVESVRTDRALEAASILEDSGEGYVKRLRQVLKKREKSERKKAKKSGEARDGHGDVMQDVVESVLLLLRDSDEVFCNAFTQALLSSFEKHTHGPTLVLIASAATCEYAHLCDLQPQDIIQILVPCLEDSPPSIQEALLLAILRTSTRCENIDERTLEVVQKLKVSSGRHIRRRCEQFETLVQDRALLRRVAQPAKSRTLPGFLAAIEAHFLKPTSSSSTPSQTPSSPRLTASKLRYAAYDTPSPARKSQRSYSSSSVRSHSTAPSEREQGRGSMERTVTPGELALMVENMNWREQLNQPLRTHDEEGPASSSSAETSYRPDLIGLESPVSPEQSFHPFEESVPPRPSTPHNPDDFDELWRQLGDSKETLSRGWCGESPTTVMAGLRRRTASLEAWDEDPTGIRAYIRGNNHTFAVLLCRKGDDESCLWILKCEDTILRSRLKDIIQDGA